jgi:hypothetical protein
VDDDTLEALMLQLGIDPRRQQSTAGRIADRTPYRTPAPAPTREQQRAAYDAAQRDRQRPRAAEAYQDPRNQFAEAGGMALEATGLPAVRRSARAFASGDPQTGVEEGAMGALSLATLGVGGRGARAPRPAPMRAPMPEAPPSGALRPPPRQLGTASDGSVMPVREPQPFRQSMVGGSDDLAEAARPRGALDAGNGGAVRLYRGITNGQLGGRYWTRDPEYASRQALGQGDRDGLAVMSADATFRNPYRVRDASESTMLEMPEIGRGQAWIDSLRAQGHDAIIDDLGSQIYVLDDSILTPAFGRARSPTPPRQQ